MSNWILLLNRITAEDQAALMLKSLEKAAKAGLKVWSVTADGTLVNLRTFESWDARLM